MVSLVFCGFNGCFKLSDYYSKLDKKKKMFPEGPTGNNMSPVTVCWGSLVLTHARRPYIPLSHITELDGNSVTSFKPPDIYLICGGPIRFVLSSYEKWSLAASIPKGGIMLIPSADLEW